jgi:hypothetical protein
MKSPVKLVHKHIVLPYMKNNYALLNEREEEGLEDALVEIA